MKLLKEFLLTSLFMAPYLSYGVECADASFEKPEKVDGLYVFVVSTECTLENTTVDTQKIKDVFFDKISNYEKIEVKSSDSSASRDGFYGYKLEIKETRNTSHGDLKIYSDSYIMDDKDKNFIYNVVSSKIKGDGNAANTKYESQDLTGTQSESTYNVLYTKTLKIEKPWYAPEGMFVDAVKKDVGPDVKRNAERYSTWISSAQ